MSQRIEKINDLIRDNLSRIISKNLLLKADVLVSIIKVDTSKDLRYARVFISVFPEDQQDYLKKTLFKEIYRIQGLLNKTLNLKIFPRIELVIDTTQQQVSRLEDLFEKIRKEKKKI